MRSPKVRCLDCLTPKVTNYAASVVKTCGMDVNVTRPMLASVVTLLGRDLLINVLKAAAITVAQIENATKKAAPLWLGKQRELISASPRKTVRMMLFSLLLALLLTGSHKI
jgi:hypothetical protein